MSRILFVWHAIPKFPGSGSPTRAYCLMEQLARSFDITYVLPAPASGPSQDIEILKNIGEVNTYQVTKEWRHLEWRIRQVVEGHSVLRSASLGSQPLFKYETQVIEQSLMRQLASMDVTGYDLVHVMHPHLAQSIGNLTSSIPKTIDWDADPTIIFRRELNTARTVRKSLIRFELRKIENYLRHSSLRYNESFASSKLDADRIHQIVPFRRPIVLPNGVDTNYFSNSVSERPTGNHLVFTGHMGYEPNVDAMLRFCADILPRIAAAIPDVHLTIVGMEPDARIVELQSQMPRLVTVTGGVQDVRPFFSRAAVTIAPLHNGSGTRLKILEALAMNRPVVSTQIGCEGLDLENRRHVFIQDEQSEFAEAVIRLLRNQALWHELASAGRELVEQQYSWNVIAGTVASTWRTLIEAKAQRGTTYHV